MLFLKQVKDVLVLNPFQANIALLKKPGSWFSLAACMNNNSGRVTF